MNRYALIIENDSKICQQLMPMLTQAQFDVEVFPAAEDFLLDRKLQSRCLYIISSQLSGIQCKDLINLIRVKDKFSPIFILACLGQQDKVTEILKSGADDVFIKPINPEHIMLKVSNAFKKLDLLTNDQISVGIKLIPEADLVMREGRALKLTNKEFSIIEQLLRDSKKIHNREELIEHLGTKDITSRTIDVHVSGLRKKLELINLEIETIRGKGYRIMIKEPPLSDLYLR